MPLWSVLQAAICINGLVFLGQVTVCVRVCVWCVWYVCCVCGVCVLQEEQIAQLQAFISAQCDYHRQAMETMQTLLETLEIK